jgi:apolipoprotein N-acyltransferase
MTVMPIFNSKFHWPWRVFGAILGGWISSLAFPRENIPALIFVSVALITVSVRGLRFWPAWVIGFFGGAAFYLSQIEWLTLYLGPVPWLALSTLESLIFAFGMATVAVVWAWLEKSLGFATMWRSSVIAFLIAIIWTAREWVSISFPYGGFPWSRLSQTQSDTYLADWVFVGGLGLLTFVVAFISIQVLLWIIEFRTSGSKPGILGAGLLAGCLLLPLAINPGVTAEQGTVTIGAVQGNANAGLFSNETPGKILQNHLDATKLMQESELYSDLDVVVWPENASDLSPFSNKFSRDAITKLVNDELKVPLIFGTITERGEEIFNSSILWLPQTGPVDYYDKKRPVPFAEYVPDRDFWYQLAPDLIGLVSRGYTFGTRDGIFEIGQQKYGALICFEIAIDDIGRDLVADGAQVILSQTNNADFGRSDETYQQAAFARLRAIETGRYVVNISTVGVSAIYASDGSIVDEINTFEPGAMIQEVPLRTSITPAMRFGAVFDLIFNLLAAGLIGTFTFFKLRTRFEVDASRRGRK